MSAELLTPDEETIENRIRFTVEDWYRFRDLGLIEGRFEILDGMGVTKMGQKPPHYFAISRLTSWASEVFGLDSIRIQGPISIPGPEGLYNEPEPDVAVTREDTTAYSDRHPDPDDLHLVVEVSDTTLRTDLVLKARLYARAGIAEYWALDLAARQLHVHRIPANGKYGDVTILTESESVSPLARTDSALQIADLFPPTD